MKVGSVIETNELGRIIDLVPDPIFVHQQGVLLYVNDAAVRCFGFSSAAELVGQNVVEKLLHPDDVDHVKARMSALQAGAGEVPAELFRFRRLDGGLVWLEAKATPVRLATSETVVLVAAREVTRSKEFKERFRLLLEVATSLVGNLEAATARKALALANAALGTSLAIISNVSDERYVIQYCAAPEGTLSPGQEFAFADTYCEMTLQANDIVAIHNMGATNRSSHPCYAAFALETYIGVPLRVGGELYGTLNFSDPSRRAHAWGRDEIDLVRILGLWMGRTLEAHLANRALQAGHSEMRKLALVDALTGLPNRRAGEEYLQRCAESAQVSGAPLCVAIADIDKFKNINDKYGHAVGDEAIVTTARCLTSSLRGDDMAARWGGEEVILILPHTGPDEALMIAERLRKRVAAQVHDEFKTLTVSIGIAQLESGESSHAALDRADQALYQSKQAGRNQSCFAPSLVPQERDTVTFNAQDLLGEIQKPNEDS